MATREGQDIRPSLAAAIDLADRRHAGHRRRPEAPDLREPIGVLVVDGEAEAERCGLRSHLGAALDAAVAPDRHEAALLSPDDPAVLPAVHDPLDVRHGQAL